MKIDQEEKMVLEIGEQAAESIRKFAIAAEQASEALAKISPAVVIVTPERSRLERLIIKAEFWLDSLIYPRQLAAEKWLRWKIIQPLGQLEEFCWANLVMWAINPELHEGADLFEETMNAGQCARTNQYPYCGKCAITGVHQRTNPDAPLGGFIPDDIP